MPMPGHIDSILTDLGNVVLHFTLYRGRYGQFDLFFDVGVRSDSALFLDAGWDNGDSGEYYPSSPYTYVDGYGPAGDFSPNYYDMGLAHYAFYFRSKCRGVEIGERDLEDLWIHAPNVAEGLAGGAPRDQSVLGVLLRLCSMEIGARIGRAFATLRRGV